MLSIQCTVEKSFQLYSKENIFEEAHTLFAVVVFGFTLTPHTPQPPRSFFVQQTLTNIHRLSTQPGWPGWQQAITRLEGRQWYRTGPASYSAGFQLYISGVLQAGGKSICLCLTGVLLWPLRRPTRTACVHFRDSYPIDVLHLNFNILSVLWLLLLQVSISVAANIQGQAVWRRKRII